MKKVSIRLVYCAIIFSCGCHSEKSDSKLSFKNSIESFFAWTDHPPSNYIWSNVAHSGNYVCKIDSAAPFSATFNMKLSDISKKPLKYIHVSAWVNISSLNINPELCIDLRDASQKTLQWTTRSALDFITAPNEWKEVSIDYTIDEKINYGPNNYLRIFVGNNKPEYALVDDIEITCTEK